MRKLTSIVLMSALAVMVLGPAVGTATVSTGLDRGTGGGADPIVKVKWEMNGPSWDANGAFIGTGTDDSTDAGAQFNAPGVWETDMNYTVCAIATDPNGASDIVGVYADISYPGDRAFHPMDPNNPDLINGGPEQGNNGPLGQYSPDYDYGVNGCGAFIEENTLLKLSKEDGIQLFCNDIRNNNYNLPIFSSGYNYDEICGAIGELEKEEAYVYCDDKTLIWEDPAGMYKVDVFAQDQAGNSSIILTNYYEYLPFTGFEVDFNTVNYGEVLLNTHKIISGDLTWDGVNNGASKASVRNTGNTRLYMWVDQDDMGLGQTSGEWNVEYDARVGNKFADWRIYDPEVNQPLEDILDLSELEEMDFSILVTKWPNAYTTYSGDMVLSATQAEFRQCYE